MLEQPPALLQPAWALLANLTGWFDWSALEAIGTVGALWFAVVQSSRSARADRTRQIGTLTALIGLVEPITQAVPIFDGDEEGRLDPDEIEYLLDANHIVQRAIDGLERLPHADVAAVGATEYVGALPLALRYILEQLPTTISSTVYAADINRVSAYPGEACEFFSAQRDYIQYGRLGSYLRAGLRRLENRFWRWRFRHYTAPGSPSPPVTTASEEK
jgi:hypothetical protein